MNIAIFVFFIGVNLLIAIINNDQRVRNIKNGVKEQINHPLWAGIYTAMCFTFWPIMDNIWLALSVLPIHLWFFAPAFNIIAREPVGAFGLSNTSTAWTDRTLIKLGFKNMRFVCALAFGISITLLWRSLKH